MAISIRKGPTLIHTMLEYHCVKLGKRRYECVKGNLKRGILFCFEIMNVSGSGIVSRDEFDLFFDTFHSLEDVVGGFYARWS